MNYDDVQALLLKEIETASEPHKAGEKPLFEFNQDDPQQKIIRYFVSAEKQRLTPIDLFRKMSLEERQLLKYFLLLLAIEHPQHFKNISDECLFMRVLNTERKSYNTIAPGKTQSSRHFNWVVRKNNHWDANPTKFKPIIPHTEQTQPCAAAEFIFQRAITLFNQGNRNASKRTLEFLIHLHDEQCLTKNEPTLSLLADAFIHLANHARTAYHETSSPDLLSTYLKHLVRADFLSPTQDMAHVTACLKNPGTQTAIRQHPNAYLLFSRLYNLLPPMQQRPVLLAWLANTSRFNTHFLKLNLQLLLLSTQHPCELDHTIIYDPLTSYCIDYLKSDNDDERNQVKQSLAKQSSPEADCLRLQIQLLENEEDISANLENLGDSETAKRLQVTLHYKALTRTQRSIYHLEAINKNHPEIENLRRLHKRQQQTVIDISRLFIHSLSTPTLSEMTAMLYLLLNLPDTNNALALAHSLLTRDDVIAHYYDTAEYQSLASNLADQYRNACAYQAQAAHLRPFYAPYYHNYATLAEANKDHKSEKKGRIEYLKIASKHAYPNEETTNARSQEFVTMVFSKNLPWLHKHFPDQAGAFHRGALAHWQRLYPLYGELPDSKIVDRIKGFYKDYPYETFQTLAEGWPDNQRHLRFDALLALAKTLNKWRCYKVLFLTPGLMAEKEDRDIFELVKTLPNEHLLTRAFKLVLTPGTLLHSKLINYQPHLNTLQKTLTDTSVTSVGLFQPFNTLFNKKKPNGAPTLQNRL